MSVTKQDVLTALSSVVRKYTETGRDLVTALNTYNYVEAGRLMELLNECYKVTEASVQNLGILASMSDSLPEESKYEGTLQQVKRMETEFDKQTDVANRKLEEIEDRKADSKESALTSANTAQSMITGALVGTSPVTPNPTGIVNLTNQTTDVATTKMARASAKTTRAANSGVIEKVNKVKDMPSSLSNTFNEIFKVTNKVGLDAKVFDF